MNKTLGEFDNFISSKAFNVEVLGTPWKYNPLWDKEPGEKKNAGFKVKLEAFGRFLEFHGLPQVLYCALKISGEQFFIGASVPSVHEFQNAMGLFYEKHLSDTDLGTLRALGLKKKHLARDVERLEEIHVGKA